MLPCLRHPCSSPPCLLMRLALFPSRKVTVGVPVATGLAALAAGESLGYSELSNFAGLASAVLCMQSIGGLSSQSTARFGSVLGIGGVALGLAATIGLMFHNGVSPEVFGQMAALMGLGGLAGFAVAGKVRYSAWDTVDSVWVVPGGLKWTILST